MGSLCYMMAATLCSAFPDSFIADLLPVGIILHWLLPPRSIFFLCGSRCTRLASLRIGPFNPSKQGAAAQSMLATRNNCRQGGGNPTSSDGCCQKSMEFFAIAIRPLPSCNLQFFPKICYCRNPLMMGDPLKLGKRMMRWCPSVLSRG